jgi:hypothetical protein
VEIHLSNCSHETKSTFLHWNTQWWSNSKI